MPVSIARLVSALQQFWLAEFSPEVPTMFPGVRLPGTALREWVELWLTPLGMPRFRRGHPEQREATITVHAFSRHPTNKLALAELITDISNTLTQAQIPIRSTAEPESALVAWLSVREPTVHDLSRSHSSDFADHLAHAVIVFPALVHRWP